MTATRLVIGAATGAAGLKGSPGGLPWFGEARVVGGVAAYWFGSVLGGLRCWLPGRSAMVGLVTLILSRHHFSHVPACASYSDLGSSMSPPSISRLHALGAAAVMAILSITPAAADPIAIQDDARGTIFALSVFGNAGAYDGIAISGTGNASNAYLAALSILGSASGVHAISGTGHAHGETIAISLLGTATCYGSGCIAVGGELP